MLSVQTKPFFFLKTIMRTTDSATPDQADETVTDSTETSIIPSTSNVILVQPSTSKSMLAQKSSDLALNKDRDCSVQQIILLPVPNERGRTLSRAQCRGADVLLSVTSSSPHRISMIRLPNSYTVPPPIYSVLLTSCELVYMYV
ncbi:hypothetical protein AB6A40_008067 [Gnathostoma spinigerum]|uniref:Uncharacterized protein n=1 Tax=Gnathostoma spinigerum TaxID=75299 RepID=A0ABD6EWC4_9BILA